jgi:hypothetical protein
MLDYTFAALGKTVEDFKKLQFGFSVTVQAAYIFYLIYAIAFGVGFLAVNIVLLALSIAYFVFFLVTQSREKKDKKLGRTVKAIYKSAKHFIKIFTLASAIMSICIEKEEVTPFAIMFVALMVVGFVLQVIIDVAVSIVSAKMDFFKEALIADYEETIKKPLEEIKSKVLFWKKEEPKAAEKNKNRVLLDSLVESKRSEKVANKNKKKEAKREEKQSKRAALKEKIYGSTIGRLKKKKEKAPASSPPASENENEIPALAAPGEKTDK